MRHFANLLSSLIPSNQSAFEHKLLNSSLMSNGPGIQMSDILYLIECFEGYGPEYNGMYMSGNEYIEQFFVTTTNKQLKGLATIKLCLTLHLILYEFQVGEYVSDAMLKYQLPKTNQKDVYFSFIANYSVYLMKIAQGLKIFYAAKVGQYPPLENCEENIKKKVLDADNFMEAQTQNFLHMKKQSKFSENNIYFQQYQQQQFEKSYQNTPGQITTHQKTLFLFKLHNLTNTALQLLKQSIEQLQYLQTLQNKEAEDISHLFIEISCVLWNDAMVMYKFTGQEISRLLDTFRNQETHILLSTQQLYHSIVDITEKLKWLYLNRSAFDIQKIVRRPFWFEENRKLTIDLENAVIDTKVRAGKSVLVIPESQRGSNAGHGNSISSGKNHPFSVRASSQTQNQFFLSTKLPIYPLSPQQKSHHRLDSNQLQQKKQNFFKKISGGIFNEDCEIMAQPVINVIKEMALEETKESVARSKRQ